MACMAAPCGSNCARPRPWRRLGHDGLPAELAAVDSPLCDMFAALTGMMGKAGMPPHCRISPRPVGHIWDDINEHKYRNGYACRPQ
jgi:hypothetical protein